MVGFKPPYGRVPQSAPFNLDFYCHEGPMARTVADVAANGGVMPPKSTDFFPKMLTGFVFYDTRS